MMARRPSIPARTRGGCKPAPKTHVLEKEAFRAVRRLLARHEAADFKLRKFQDPAGINLWVYNTVRIVSLRKALTLVKGISPRK